MSKKYIPSFIKEQYPPTQNTTDTHFWPTSQSSCNRFSILSDDNNNLVQSNNTAKPISKKTSTIIPATLASLTSTQNKSNGNSGSGHSSGGKSYASRFTDKLKTIENPNYKPPPKQVDFKSAIEFPTLTSNKSSNTVLIPTTLCSTITDNQSSKFTELAKNWAEKSENDTHINNTLKQKKYKEHRRRELEKQLCVIIPMPRLNKNNLINEDEEQLNDDSSLSSDFETMEPNDESSTDVDEDDEYNQTTEWDGRRRGDLY